MIIKSKLVMLTIVGAAALSAVALVTQSNWRVRAAEEASIPEGARALKGAVDIHVHIDPDTDATYLWGTNIHTLKDMRSRGVRAVVLKDHRGPTAALAYLLRQEIPGMEIFGGIVLNLYTGGINLVALEEMSHMTDRPGRYVWMPTLDAESAVRASANPSRPFVGISRNGDLLPDVKKAISLIAKNDMVLATGHSSPEEDLMLLREGRSQGAKHMVVTHPYQPTLTSLRAMQMNEAQMREATKLGAFLEFDYRILLDSEKRNTPPAPGGIVEMLRKIGPEFCILSEFFTRDPHVHAEGLTPEIIRRYGPFIREYGGYGGIAQFVTAMRGKGFTDRELVVMMKENPARLLGLSASAPEQTRP